MLTLTLGPVLAGLPVIVRTFVLSTTAVPVVIYAIMPWLHRARARLVRRGRWSLS